LGPQRLVHPEDPMVVDVSNELECRRRFLEHRAAVPAEALARHAGRWIAWSPDGSRVVAEAGAPEDLDDAVRAAGEDPERCVIEGIPAVDALLGGEGLGPAAP
jgi:glucose/arabinose dehydrogenase